MVENEDNLEVRTVGQKAWRISDARMPESDAMRVLGFAERKSGFYEVMHVSQGFDWEAVDTFEDVMEVFAGLVDEHESRDEHPLAGLYAGAAR